MRNHIKTSNKRPSQRIYPKKKDYALRSLYQRETAMITSYNRIRIVSRVFCSFFKFCIECYTIDTFYESILEAPRPFRKRTWILCPCIIIQREIKLEILSYPYLTLRP